MDAGDVVAADLQPDLEPLGGALQVVGPEDEMLAAALGVPERIWPGSTLGTWLVAVAGTQVQLRDSTKARARRRRTHKV